MRCLYESPARVALDLGQAAGGSGVQSQHICIFFIGFNVCGQQQKKEENKRRVNTRV